MEYFRSRGRAKSKFRTTSFWSNRIYSRSNSLDKLLSREELTKYTASFGEEIAGPIKSTTTNGQSGRVSSPFRVITEGAFPT